MTPRRNPGGVVDPMEYTVSDPRFWSSNAIRHLTFDTTTNHSGAVQILHGFFCVALIFELDVGKSRRATGNPALDDSAEFGELVFEVSRIWRLVAEVTDVDFVV